MDLGEKDDMCDYEKIHRLIESTYKNILKNFNPGVKQLIILGKVLQKTIQNVGSSLKAYNECLYELARSAEACKGSTQEIGLALLQLTDAQNEISQQLSDGIKVFHAELLIPLKAKQENEFRHIQVIFDKYLAGHKYHSNNLRKAQNALAKCKKKAKAKSGQKEMEKTRHMKDCKGRLEEYLRKNLRLALLEERKRYCYFLNRLLCVVEDKVKKYTRANDVLSEGLRHWPELCRSPHILPSATEQIIHEFGFSDDSCDVEEEPSGDGDHGDGRCGRTSSLNRRDPRHEEPQRYDWSNKKRLTLDGTSSAAAAIAAVAEGMNAVLSSDGSPTPEAATPDPIARGTETPEVIHQVATPTGILCAVYPYVAATETQMSLEVNDVIRVFGDVQNGWLYGRNIRTNKEGWFPLSFTDFNEELIHWKPSHLSHLQAHHQSSNTSLAKIRNTWHTEEGYDLERGPSRCNESASTDLSGAAAPVTIAPTMPTARPMSLCVSVSPKDSVDQQIIRAKIKRILPLESISESIPPPEEFRDGTVDQTNVSALKCSISRLPDAEKPKPVSATEEKRREAESRTTKEQIATTNGPDGSLNQSEDLARKQRIEEFRAEDQRRITPSADYEKVDAAPPSESSLQHVGVSQSVLHALPPPPSPLPPLPPPAVLSKPSRPTSTPGSTSPAQVNHSLGSGTSPGAKQKQMSISKIPIDEIGVTGSGAAGASQQPPPPAPPPPPPPPLPPGSYQSIRSEYFARPRLRKAGSTDSTKTN